jgi:phage shock protein PspC (stress-responsive transcriptional regulator)
MIHEWTRSERGKMIAGVCAGLAEQFDISVTVVRLAFVLGTLIGGGIGILVYVILWIVMPEADDVHGRALWSSDLPESVNDDEPLQASGRRDPARGEIDPGALSQRSRDFDRDR